MLRDDTIGDLVQRYQATGDEGVRARIVEAMRPVVTRVARRFAGREPLEDLESEGMLGLLQAIDRYQPGRGTRFSTFAHHLIAGTVRHYLRDRGHLIRQPAWLQELDHRVRRVQDDLEQRLQHPPTVAEVARHANLAEEAVEELLAARKLATTLRLEGSAGDEEESLLDIDPEKIRSRSYVTLELPIEDRIALEAAMDRLKGLEKKVVRYFFFHEFNKSEIARLLGISCNYSGYLLRQALVKLRDRLPEELEGAKGALGSIAAAAAVTLPSGVCGRARFEQRLHEEVTRAQRFEDELSLCVFRLPDELTAAEVIEAAALVRSRTRKADVIALSGEREIAALLPGTGPVAERVVDRLLDDLEGLLGRRVYGTSATFPDHGRAPRDLLARVRMPLASPTAAPLPALTGEQRTPARV